MFGYCEHALVTRHLWENFKAVINANRLSDLGKRLYARRKETVERSFADAKELHGHRYARFRGLAKVQAQCLLSAACQNMKKMALLLAKKAAALLAKFLARSPRVWCEAWFAQQINALARNFRKQPVWA